jgi:hypothetical protein
MADGGVALNEASNYPPDLSRQVGEADIAQIVSQNRVCRRTGSPKDDFGDNRLA